MSEPTNATPAVRAEIQPGIWLDARRALWIEAERLLVLSDLHWGYAASHRACGNLIPLWGDDEIERRLNTLVADYAPAEMLWLGDIVHAAEGAERVERYLAAPPVKTTILAGNHDRRWRRAIDTTAIRGRFFLHHGDVERPAPSNSIEIIGHHHPAIAWSDGAGGNVKMPALVASSQRLILPAFSPWASGTDCTPQLKPNSTVWAVSSKRIFSLPARYCLSAAV